MLANYYRSNIEILTSILRFVSRKGHALKTHIMYAANLNSVAASRFLGKLTSAGALKKVVEGRRERYVITPVGEVLLSLLERIEGILEGKSQRFEKNVKAIERLINDEFKVDYSVTVRGISGVVHNFSTVLTRRRCREDCDKYVLEFIDKDLDVDMAVEFLSKVWLSGIDTGYKVILVVPEAHYYQLKAFKETIEASSLKETIHLIAFNTGEEYRLVNKILSLT